MKKMMLIIIISLSCFIFAGCSKIFDVHKEPDVPDNVLKATYNDSNNNQVIVYQNDDDSYGFIVSIDGLSKIGGNATATQNGFMFDGTDTKGKQIKMSFIETDSYTLKVITSKWDKLPANKTFTGFKPQIVE